MRVEVDWTGGIAFTATARQFSLQIDEPETFHGADTGPSAAEYLAIGVGGCLGTSFAHCARQVDLPIASIKVIVDVDMHHGGEDRTRPLRITGMATELVVTLKDESDMDVFDLCVESFKKYCVVTQSVISGIPVDVKVTRAT
ncbi:MAG: OsmC family protein [Candidatus Lokiarchaeota archaeon]|nr:OsmC family protein [Candidatus Lokiarchaeota archaeon]